MLLPKGLGNRGRSKAPDLELLIEQSSAEILELELDAPIAKLSEILKTTPSAVSLPYYGNHRHRGKFQVTNVRVVRNLGDEAVGSTLPSSLALLWFFSVALAREDSSTEVVWVEYRYRMNEMQFDFGFNVPQTTVCLGIKELSLSQPTGKKNFP
ncbi:hypothetical protein B0H13DRAFT_1907384 [Mycena leptocephala]|nr:hypothetical protein B0H13DRAFT_1907384 [Mycena leptocephala]